MLRFLFGAAIAALGYCTYRWFTQTEWPDPLESTLYVSPSHTHGTASPALAAI